MNVHLLTYYMVCNEYKLLYIKGSNTNCTMLQFIMDSIILLPIFIQSVEDNLLLVQPSFCDKHKKGV